MPGADTSPDPAQLQRWWQEHSELDSRVEELVATIADQNVSGARAALEELSLAMEAHLSVEEDVYFPLVEALSHAHGSSLRQARLAHIEVRANLDVIRERLSQAELAAARGVLRTLLDRFRTHEQLEAQLITDLQAAPRT